MAAPRRRGSTTEPPRVLHTRLWQVPPPVSEYLSTIRESKTCVAILENGTRVIHRHTITPRKDAAYLVVDGWLVEETHPRWEAKAVERAAKDKIARAAYATKAKAEAAHQATLVGAPGFKKLLADLSKALGAPEIHDREIATKIYYVDAPPVAKVPVWFGRARAANASMTLVRHPAGDQLALIAGPVEKLAAAVFGYSPWTSTRAQRALRSLDRDARVQIEFVDSGSSTGFCLALDRIPTKLEEHATRLAPIFGVDADVLVRSLRKRRWRHRMV